MKPLVFAVIFLSLMCVLSTRRIGLAHWQFYAVSVLVALASFAGRFA